MRQRNAIPFFVLISAVLFLAACTFGPRPEDLASPLTKLTSLVQAEVRYPDPNAPITDEALISAAFQEAPELGETFHGIPILLRHNDKNVVLLVLSPDRKHAWLEDESSTTILDKLWYKLNKEQPPVFTLTPGTE